ncbi:MAG TPA: (2Fe-2S)-binding protein [Tepidisphaeraceae bacterium]|jgi:aerobic-type carbon monoxide dehydrogenase small subunit (CoxS/CutS family)|nr:(2Fe-2S)-binding protein [Tepidisphaeraceae bacterium]
MNQRISFFVNGQQQTVNTDADRPLLDVLREDLGLTGAKYGCGEGKCGACSVLMGDKRVFSCRTPMKIARNQQITTIEGISDGTKLHPVQQAFYDAEAYQCGYCTPGWIMATIALLKNKNQPTEDEIVSFLDGNLCRCCGYPRILNAVRQCAGLKGR